MKTPLDHYTAITAHGTAADASPAKIVQLLLTRAVERIKRARSCIEQNNIIQKCENISRVIAIFEALQSSLDRKAGGLLAENLELLYIYMTQCLVRANLNNDVGLLEQVIDLLTTVKGGWDGIV